MHAFIYLSLLLTTPLLLLDKKEEMHAFMCICMYIHTNACIYLTPLLLSTLLLLTR